MSDIALSHFELKVRDLGVMEDFYTRALGFVVTDRSESMIFLSAHPGEHHQLVLGRAADGDFRSGSLDHLAFRVGNLSALKARHADLAAIGDVEMEGVSHGNAWSIYLRDPEGNRLEIFTDTPWHVAQPVRFAVDLAMAEDDLIAWTEAKVSVMPGYRPLGEWQGDHKKALGRSER